MIQKSGLRTVKSSVVFTPESTIEDFEKAFCSVDVLLTPTSPTTAFPFGAHSDNPLAMYLADLLTIPANLAGLPAISLPCGFDGSGLPIGLQLITNVLEEFVSRNQLNIVLFYGFQLKCVLY